jgi:hypothetical protein
MTWSAASRERLSAAHFPAAMSKLNWSFWSCRGALQSSDASKERSMDIYGLCILWIHLYTDFLHHGNIETLWHFSMLSNTNIGHIRDIHWNFQTTWCGSFNHNHIDCSVHPRHLLVQIMSWVVTFTSVHCCCHYFHFPFIPPFPVGSWVSVAPLLYKSTIDFWMFWGVLRSETGDWDDHIRWIFY